MSCNSLKNFSQFKKKFLHNLQTNFAQFLVSVSFFENFTQFLRKFHSVFQKISHNLLENFTQFLCLVYILIETARDKMGIRVWREHSSCLSHSQLVLVLSQSSRKHVGKSYPSQRTRIPCLIIQATFNFVSQLSHKIVNFYICGYLVLFTSCWKSQQMPSTKV